MYTYYVVDSISYHAKTNTNAVDQTHMITNTADTLTPKLPTNILDFRGFDSSMILIITGGIPWPIGNVLEN